MTYAKFVTKVETIQQLLDENQTELIGIQKVLNDVYGKNHVLKVDYSTMTVEEYKKLVKEMKEIKDYKVKKNQVTLLQRCQSKKMITNMNYKNIIIK